MPTQAYRKDTVHYLLSLIPFPTCHIRSLFQCVAFSLVQKAPGTPGSFKEIGGLEQPVMLLRHLALVFGKRTFDPHKVPEEICGFVFTKGLAYSSAELQDAHLYILTDPWPWIVDQGYVAEAPPGSGMYEITAWGWARVESPK